MKHVGIKARCLFSRNVTITSISLLRNASVRPWLFTLMAIQRHLEKKICTCSISQFDLSFLSTFLFSNHLQVSYPEAMSHAPS